MTPSPPLFGRLPCSPPPPPPAPPPLEGALLQFEFAEAFKARNQEGRHNWTPFSQVLYIHCASPPFQVFHRLSPALSCVAFLVPAACRSNVFLSLLYVHMVGTCMCAYAVWGLKHTVLVRDKT